MARQKTKQLTVWVQDRPGILGEVAVALGAKKVNILALVASVVEGSGALRMVVDKPAEAKEIFTQRGWKTTEEELVSFALPDQPGQLGSVSKKLGDAGINIHYAYTGAAQGATEASAYLAVSDVEAALKALR